MLLTPRRTLLALLPPALALARPGRALPPPGLAGEAIRQRAEAIPRLHALIVARAGEVVLAERLRGPALDRPVNVKSVSKAVMTALAGIAIGKSVLQGTEQKLVDVLGNLVPAEADPRVGEITIGHLLSMQAGLASTSGVNYGAWVNSPNWVRHILTRPFETEPGGWMVYSTGTSHLLSAALTVASGESTLSLARSWLGRPLNITIPAWDRDPQGIYLGGNNMALSPRALLAFGELYRNDGMAGGERILPEGWVAQSWQERTISNWTGDGYGYGWFGREVRGHPVRFAWGYGGQMLFVVPDLALTVVMTSDPSPRPRGDGHLDALHGLLGEVILPAAAGIGQ
ncbi:serine hydrolase domain-containing protein [Geminicoccus flavidas]|uniref:serine hydrolase domain-containing protein n=1 Tax=Geminicoccus flavidas TaxID=2506407 RepID=UPI00135A904B|nr:serine hydrolase [Geminicoccus flavidas]